MLVEEKKVNFLNFDAVYKDRRKDLTFIMKKTDSGKYTSAKLEHNVIIRQPVKFCLLYFSPENGISHTISRHIHNIISNSDLETELIVIGSDGTAAMTGHTTGCIA